MEANHRMNIRVGPSSCILTGGKNFTNGVALYVSPLLPKYSPLKYLHIRHRIKLRFFFFFEA